MRSRPELLAAISLLHGKMLSKNGTKEIRAEQRVGNILERLDPAVPEAQTTLDYTIS